MIQWSVITQLTSFTDQSDACIRVTWSLWPIRDKYLGHVINLDQSEVSFTDPNLSNCSHENNVLTSSSFFNPLNLRCRSQQLWQQPYQRTTINNSKNDNSTQSSIFGLTYLLMYYVLYGPMEWEESIVQTTKVGLHTSSRYIRDWHLPRSVIISSRRLIWGGKLQRRRMSRLSRHDILSYQLIASHWSRVTWILASYWSHIMISETGCRRN